MECEKIRDKFSSLLERDLDPSEERILKEHLASCPGCQKDFETFRKTMNWLHSVDEVESPEGLLEEVYQKIEDRKGMGSRQAWGHRLMRLKLPAQAVAMVAIVFVVLYITKMIPMETPPRKNAEVTRTAPSEVKKDAHSAQEETKTEKEEIALLSKEPGAKEMEHKKGPLPEGKEIERVTIPFLAAKPPQEIVLKVQDQEKAISQLEGLVKEFGGEIAREEGYIVLASLPTASYSQFEKKLEGMTSSQKAEPAAPQQVAPRASRISPSSTEEGYVGKGKEREMTRPMADQAGRITVRILLVKE